VMSFRILPTGLSCSIETNAQCIKQFMANIPTNRTQITCYRCGEQGHYKSECFHWKTRLCWHYTHSICKDNNCSFAHGLQQLRTPWLPRCVRVIKRNGQLECVGCFQYGHTYKFCTNNTNILSS
jgi:hypothetical protein